MTKPYMTFRCTAQEESEKGIEATFTILELEGSRLSLLIGPEWDPPSVGSEFAVTLPVRRRRGAK